MPLQSEVAAIAGTTGRDPSRNEVDEQRRPIAARPLSEITGVHDEGSGANETVDGFSESEEAIRQGAEETPVGRRPQNIDDIPVFDRGDALPEV